MTDRFTDKCTEAAIDEDMFGAGLIIIILAVAFAGCLLATGLWKYALAAWAGAWMQKRFGK